MAALKGYSKIWRVLTLLATFSSCHAMIEEMPVPHGLEDCFSRYASKTNILKTVGQSINWICVHQYTWVMNGKQGWMRYNITMDTNRWFGRLLQFTKRGNIIRFKRQTRRARKEIRMMGEKERNDFWRAIHLMKSDRSVYPNRYDALAALHQGIAETSAHGGPNFLGWHRVYLTMFENALREYIPSVTIPYWDSTLDDKMNNPKQSIIWSRNFFGNGNGIVNTGPFANWMTPSGPLIRNIGNGGQLFRSSDIRRILSRTRVRDITEPLGPTSHNLEFHHGEVHLYVDGQMADLTTASHDPIFYLHHCYVDYVWEMFRRRQRMTGVNPDMDYPMIVNHTLHTARAPLGLGTMRNIDSYSQRMIAGIYHYETSPRCSATNRNCGSPYLRCQYLHREWTCVSVDRSFARSNNVNPSVDNSMNMQILRNTQHMRNIENLRNTQANLQRGRNMNMVQPMSRSSSSPNIDLHRIMKVNNIDPNMVFPVMNSADRNRFFANNNQQSNVAGKSPVFIKANNGNMMVSVTREQTNPANFVIHQITVNTTGSGFSQSNVNTAGVSNIFSQKIQKASSGPPIQQESSNENCPAIPVNQPYQNTFNINGRSDTRQWVYLPVNIVYRRPPEFKKYNAFPIYNSQPYKATDIYAPQAYKTIKTRLDVGRLASYRWCKTGESGAGSVFIQSNGINYIGNYKEYAIVDHRMAISMSTAMVAVKNPLGGITEVMLSAHDSCGRVCRPFCRDPTNPSGMRRCTGMLRINSRSPKFYGADYGEAVFNTWNLKAANCPNIDRSNIFITFYCDYEEVWPLPGTVPPSPAPITFPMRFPIRVPGTRFAATMMNVMVCKIGNGCIIRAHCNPCVHGVTMKCEGTCSLYAKCNRGTYETRYCTEGRQYNRMTGKCERGTCPEEETPPPLKFVIPTTPSPTSVTGSGTTIFDDK